MVDDSALTRKMVCQVLQMNNGHCRCDQAGEGAIGVEMVRRSLYLDQLSGNKLRIYIHVLRVYYYCHYYYFYYYYH